MAALPRRLLKKNLFLELSITTINEKVQGNLKHHFNQENMSRLRLLVYYGNYLMQS